jgi:hypothetical protein
VGDTGSDKEIAETQREYVLKGINPRVWCLGVLVWKRKRKTKRRVEVKSEGEREREQARGGGR